MSDKEMVTVKFTEGRDGSLVGLITLDVGTTSIKTCLFSETFELLAYSSQEYQLLTPQSNIVELDPEVYWKAAQTGIKNVVAKSGVNTQDIKAITITTQGETLIPVDREGKALYNAVVWLDARAEEETAILRDRLSEDAFYRNTGLAEIGPSCPICKVLWFKRNRPEVFEKTHKFLLLMDYLILRLTGEYATDPSIMSSTGYLDINSGRLWDKALEALGMGTDRFPSILGCGEVAGTLTRSAAETLGLSVSVAVTTGGMDQISSAVGAGNIQPGIVTETTGTALVIAATALKPDYDNPYKVSIYRHFDEKFILMPYCPTAGIILKWFKDEFCREETAQSVKEGVSVYQVMDRLAASVDSSAGLLLLPHFAGKLTPDANPYAKGVFYGVGLETRKEHFIRALMESIGFMLRENIELIENFGVPVKEIRSLGGGSRSKLWRSMKTDICGKNMIAMPQDESTSLGAAMLGALSLRLYGTMEEICSRFVKVGDILEPDASRAAEYNKSYGIYLELYNCLRPLFKGNP